ncbi:hypothetical protein ATANTOWER_017210 [Ataeniobius toweri]|uniref:G-protein coupled receptors family 1 profile domain-containing protein n=1 Tax=Ataeniobius toweri TaxID=208326 RepID=A0ABU7ARZ3_9TELE|nr:hypothetical protein [Ataeniobius toweri]
MKGIHHWTVTVTYEPPTHPLRSFHDHKARYIRRNKPGTVHRSAEHTLFSSVIVCSNLSGNCLILEYVVCFVICSLYPVKYLIVMYREGLFSVNLYSTFVRPAKFYLGGFYNIPHIKYYYVFLGFVYIMTVLGNGFLLSVIYLVKTLHTPKCIIVFNLALTDLCGSTALIPKLLDTYLFDRRYIVYEACLTYMFFVLLFLSIQSWTLVTMAYDRVVAICFPLRYYSLVTTKSVVAILLCSLIILISVIATLTGFINRLSFCASLEIKTFFCDHGPIYQLACNDKSYSYMMANDALILVICIPLIVIFGSYVCISIALARTTSRGKRLRAMKTCTFHLILVAIFFLPFVGTNIAVLTSYIHPNARNLNSSLTYTIPPLLNPIIYSLKTEEVRNAIRRLCKRDKLNKTAIK